MKKASNKKGRRYVTKTKKINIKRILLFIVIFIVLCIIFPFTIKTITTSKSDKFLASIKERMQQIEDNYDKTAGQKALVSSLQLTERETGEGPFDADSTPGNDENANNDIIRTLDFLSYTINVNMDLRENETQDITVGTIKIVATLPDNCTGKVRWDLDKMTWADSDSIVSDDGLTFVGYYTMGENQVSIPKDIKVSLVGNSEEEAAELTINSTVKVSATDKYDIVIIDEHSNYSFMSSDGEVRLNSYLLGFRLLGDPEEKGLKGVEKPEGDIEFDIDYKLLFNARRWQ